MPLKPLTGLISDVVVPLPAEDVHKSSGLALDIGSTIGKIIYRCNKAYKDGQPIKPQADSTKGHVHFAMFPRSDITGIVSYIKDKCDLQANEEGKVLVNSSGVGGAAFKKDIESGLGCKMEIIAEFDCFCKAFLALEKVLPEDELFIPKSPELQAEADNVKAKMEKAIEKFEDASDLQIPKETEEKVKAEDRPRILVMAGSGSGLMQINNDGTFSMLDGIYTAGRFMYGLSSILTGENDFAELEKMATESDGRTADTWFSDLKGKSAPGDDDDNVYSMMGDFDMIMFPFGKGINVPAEEMRKGDLVWSVFNATATIHVQTVVGNARFSKAKHVYYCGNTINTKIMRDLITTRTNLMTAMLPPDMQFEFHFLKNGGMYGAMGAYLHVKKAEAAKCMDQHITKL